MLSSKWRVARAALVACVLCIHAYVPSARAFGGFLLAQGDKLPQSNASLVVLMRDGKHTVESVQLSYQGLPEPFAWIIPIAGTLNQERIHTLPYRVFERADANSAPRLIDEEEQYPCGRGGLYGPDTEVEFGGPVLERELKLAPAFDPDAYRTTVVAGPALKSWLSEGRYNVPEALAAPMQAHIDAGDQFLIATIDPKQHGYRHGRALLPPLRFEYDARALSLPLEVGRANVPGTHDLTILVLAPTRYAVRNRPEVIIPSGLALRDQGAEQFVQFSEALFVRVREQTPDAVVTIHARAPWWTCDYCAPKQLEDSDFGALGGDSMAAASKRRLDKYTLTRLHYRYAASDTVSDLSLQPAPALPAERRPPETGGVAMGEKGQFEALYFRSRPWSGEVPCTRPAHTPWRLRSLKTVTTAAARESLVFDTDLDQMLLRPLKEARVAKARQQRPSHGR